MTGSQNILLSDRIEMEYFIRWREESQRVIEREESKTDEGESVERN